MRGPQDCEVTPVLPAAPRLSPSGDPTAQLSDAVSKPNPNMLTQLQVCNKVQVPLLSATKERFRVYSATERPQVPWKLTLELASRQRATNRSKLFCMGLVGSLGRDEEQADIFHPLCSLQGKGEDVVT